MNTHSLRRVLDVGGRLIAALRASASVLRRAGSSGDSRGGPSPAPTPAWVGPLPYGAKVQIVDADYDLVIAPAASPHPSS